MVAQKIAHFVQQSSWIRRMFETGLELKKKLGAENVFDFSLANPYLEPPQELITSWINYLQSKKQHKHSYTSNSGDLEVRKILSSKLQEKYNLNFTADLLVLCSGAAAGLNVALHSLLDPEDEVLVSAPFFPEYSFYAYNHRAVLKTVPSKADFHLDLEAIANGLNSKTKVFLINSPNNPTGVIYTKQELAALGELLKNHSQKQGKTIYLLSDEPYNQIIYDGLSHHSIFQFYKNSIVVTSHSKDVSLAGERIGYLSCHPEIEQRNELMAALVFSNRTLGFVNAPATMQALMPVIADLQVDLNYYCELRDFLYHNLTKIGYKIIKPEGAFFLFPEALEKDDVAFVNTALTFGILIVPGSGFGKSGYFRLAYAVDKKMAENSIKQFEKLFQHYNR